MKKSNTFGLEMKDYKNEGKGKKKMSAIEEPLLEQQEENKEQPQISWWDNFTLAIENWLYPPPPPPEARLIYLDGKVHPTNDVDNSIRNQKYTLFNFIPVVLYNQFKFFFNFFFLLIALSQFIGPLKVGFLFSYVAPLVFVLIMSMLKEAYDDFKRYKRDKEANSQTYNVLTETGDKKSIAAELRVGDLVEVHGNQRIPADMVLLYTNDPSGGVFIRTDQLDGETDWKLRRAIRSTQIYGRTRNLRLLNASVSASAPIQDIYKFEGLFKVEVGGGDGQRESLNLEHTLWSNTVLAAGKIIGLVIYTGRETRSMMNSRVPRSKMGQIDMELNYLSKVLFLFMVILSILLVFLNGFKGNAFINFFRYLLLLSSIIPISLRVNLDFAKLYFAYCINNDKLIEGTVARNSTIPEELGRIQFLLTDKTGTLTQNDMVFKKLSLEAVQFTPESLKDLERMLKKNCEKSKGPLKDIADRHAAAEETSTSSSVQAGADGKSTGKKRKYVKREKDAQIRDLMTALILCHNVTPVIDDGVRVYQASSPDEVALVKFAEDLNMRLVERDQKKIVIETPKKEIETYSILANFPFSSETKRMGIILRHEETQRHVFYLKGADAIMKYKVPEVQRGFLLDECENLAREGLRTLVITQKFLPKADYEKWNASFEDASAALSNREAAVRKVIEQLEHNMEFLGVTGVEDKLQEDVCGTLESMRNAGINVWMLTGDKIETATCIAISAGLKSPSQGIFEMRELEDPLLLQQSLNEFNNKTNDILVIDGVSLKNCLENHRKYFFEVSCKAPSVICCRCSPTQKALITECIKFYTNKKTCGIGDGGNDVGMIQAADVGIGIVGKEGKQAALASDFSILKFKYLTQLLLWHGRLSYKRAAVMSQFVIHRGLVISVIQLVFILMFYFVAIPVYNGWLMLGYATVFTSLPVFCLILDQDVTLQKALEFPPLYKTLQKGRDLNLKTFLLWIWKSIYQGSVIMLLAMGLFEKSYLNVTTVTFTSLIVAELLNIYTELTKIHWMMIVAQLGTLGAYILSLIYLQDYLDVRSIDVPFIKNVVLITIFSWLPMHLARWLNRRYNPTENEKIMKRIRTNF